MSGDSACRRISIRDERVWLVVEGVDYFGAVSLNATPLGPIIGYNCPTEFEVTEILSPRNVLTLDVELPQYESGSAIPERPGREQLAGGPIGEVRLEIRSLAQQTDEGKQ